MSLYYQDRESLIEIGEDDRELLGAAQPGDVLLAIFRRGAGVPPWQNLIAQEFGMAFPAGQRTSLGAIVYCAVEGTDKQLRWLAWCFGTGSRCIRRPATEPRFGMMFVLNALERARNDQGADQRRGPQLRNLQYRTTSPYFQQTGHKASKDIPVGAFRVDRQSDLVSAVGGETGDEAMPTLLGGRSVNFRTDVEGVEDLLDLATTLVEGAASDLYKRNYGWVDNISLESNLDAVAALRTQLLTMLRTEPVPASVDVLFPDEYDGVDERAIQFTLLPGERVRSADRTTFTIERLGQYFRGRPPDDASLDVELRFLDDGRQLLTTSTALECICADFTMDGKQYVAYDGDFYVVEQGFVASINTQVEEIEETAIQFPAYHGGKEPDYFASFAARGVDHLIVLDRGLLRAATERGGIEAADLVDSDASLIHVKRKGKSSALSHLFFQAGNSCALLRDSADARQQLRELLSESGGPPELTRLAVAAVDSYEDRAVVPEVVFAFLGDWRRRTILALPLFSKISLAQAATRVRQLGFRPTVALIGLN